MARRPHQRKQRNAQRRREWREQQEQRGLDALNAARISRCMENSPSIQGYGLAEVIHLDQYRKDNPR